LLGILKRKTEQAVRRSKEAWFGKIADLFRRSAIDEEAWMELEELLIMADVGAQTADTLLERMKERVKRERLEESQQIYTALKEEIVKIVDVGKAEVQASHERTSPWVMLVVGVNGAGKTTSIAKLAHNFKQDSKEVILAAGDTFRAAGIEQLQTWGERAGVPVLAHQSGADPGAVVFDAVQAAKSRGIDMVIVDTAGRLHTKFNLMEELKKISRVAQKVDPTAPHEVLLVLDATTGQNGLSQAKHFTDAVGVTGIVLTKVDSTAKGGIVLAICDQLRIPIEYIGTGEAMDDLIPFDADTFAEALMGESL
jgi:fused signal recognition particle receptor